VYIIPFRPHGERRFLPVAFFGAFLSDDTPPFSKEKRHFLGQAILAENLIAPVRDIEEEVRRELRRHVP
jgi:hypothetical protein